MTRICWMLSAVCMLGSPLAVAQKSEPAKTFQPTEAEQKIFELTNLERKKKNLDPLKLNLLLCQAARKHSENMAVQGKLEHLLDGKNVDSRIQKEGYKCIVPGEVLGFCDRKAPLTMMMKVWMDSKFHRACIMHTEYTETGVGIAPDKKGQLYFTIVFARPQ
jgi:uncharacterized protein YkwD